MSKQTGSGLWKRVVEMQAGEAFELYIQSKLQSYRVLELLEQTKTTITFKVITEGGSKKQTFLKNLRVQVILDQPVEVSNFSSLKPGAMDQGVSLE